MRKYLVFFICVFLAILIIVNVNANEITGEVVTGEATQEIYMNITVIGVNSLPVLENIDSEIYVCEGNFLDYSFSITDTDEDDIAVDISPKDPFFVSPAFFSGMMYMDSKIVSGILDKDDVGGVNSGFLVYSETIFASDGQSVVTENTNITVIGINNEPVMENIGVQTIWNTGDNRTFYKQILVEDVEDGNQDSGNLVFSIDFLNR